MLIVLDGLDGEWLVGSILRRVLLLVLVLLPVLVNGLLLLYARRWWFHEQPLERRVRIFLRRGRRHLCLCLYLCLWWMVVRHYL